MRKIARFIVKNRLIVFVVFLALIAYCVISIPKVQVEYSISKYLPPDTDTSKALEIMEREFVTYGSSKILLRNVAYGEAEALAEEIRKIDGVKELKFENTPDYYASSAALFNITYAGDNSDERAVAAYRAVLDKLSGVDYVVPSPLVNDFASELAKDMAIILGIAAAVILAVLLFTSKSFAEVLVFPLVFGTAAILNMGTNHWLGTISFVSQSVCIILQLALAIDYAIILCHRFTEEKERLPGDPKAAMTEALAKAIPEILSSSLTTISGLVALMFMQLRLGYDLGIVLAKSIVCSLVTVFLLMPGLLLTFSKWMDKTKHRNFVPKISFWGRGVVKLRYVVPVIFLGLFIAGGALTTSIRYVYSEDAIDTNRPTATRVAAEEAEKIFGHDNLLVVLVPKGDYERERQVLDTVEAKEKISSALGIANVEVKDGYYLTDKISYRDFTKLADLAPSAAMGVFRLYAVLNGDYGALTNLDGYRVRMIDLVDFVFEHDEYLALEGEQKEAFDMLRGALEDAKAQLIGDTYTRLLFNIDGGVEDPATFRLIEELIPEVKAFYPDAVFAGESMSAYDLNESFVSDNILISLLTIVFIYVILMLTFRSWGLPLLLVLTIQGAIFINFAYPVITGSNLFFFVYLIVSAIQMGATIDYAIVITNRFNELKETMERKDAVVEALNRCFPTIFTSGSIMTVAAFLIGGISSSPLIASIGMYLGRGTIVSILSVMIVLPQLLLLFGKLIQKTQFPRKLKLPKFMQLRRAAREQAENTPAGEAEVLPDESGEHAPSANGTAGDCNADEK